MRAPRFSASRSQIASLLVFALSGCPEAPKPGATDGKPKIADTPTTAAKDDKGPSPTSPTSSRADIPQLAVGPVDPDDPDGTAAKKPDGPAGPKPPLPPLPPEKAAPPSPRLGELQPTEALKGKVENFFQGHAQRRVYIQTDKPLYKPGETIWLKVWDLTARALSGSHGSVGMYVELVSPKGAPVARHKLHEQSGIAQTDFPLTAGMAGGEYTLRVKTLDKVTAERPIIVQTYEPPRLKMQLEFVRKAYGPGDEVTATIAVKRPTGEPLKNHALTAAIRLDGQDLPRVTLQTDAQGDGLVKFILPQEIALGDSLLTVLADDGGLTESVAKRVPIIIKKLALAVYPEGGDLVEGVAGRIYFEAKTPLGKPADIAGHVVDDAEQTVARFESVRDGLGRVDFTPLPGRHYHLEIDRPVGVTDRYPVPTALTAGCVLRSIDDLDGQQLATRVSVRCTQARKVVLAASVRENLLDAAMVEVKADEPSIVYLEPRGVGSEALAKAQGAARVTVFSEDLVPLAERLIYRNRRARLDVTVAPRKKSFVPREKVELDITTTDALGRPVPADLALAVVDDTVLSFADDKTGNMLSRLYLEPELPGKIEEPNFYFDLSEARSAMALDLLMGTRGYRHFEWQPVLGPQLVARNENRATGSSVSDFAALRKNVPATTVPPLPTKPVAQLVIPDHDEKKSVADKGTVFAQVRPTPAPGKKMGPVKDAADMMEKDAERRPPPSPPMALAPRKAVAKADAAPEASRAAPRPVATAAAEPVMRAPKEEVAEGQAMPATKAKAAKVAAGPMDRAARDDDMGGDRNVGDAPMAMGHLGFGRAEGGGVKGGLFLAKRPAVHRHPVETWAPVRVFPVPTYTPDYAGPRTDFRETVLWQPVVQTGQDGKASVSFFLSDAITSFRVVTEGVAAGAAGRDETVIKASLPFSMAVKLPLEVSEGDKLQLPLVLTNERSEPQKVDLTATFGPLLTLDRAVDRTHGTIAASARDTLYYPLTVTGKKGQSEVHFIADAGGLRDEFTRSVRVSPRGFPQHSSRAGRLKGTEGWSAELDLGEVLPGTAEGHVKIYTSPVSTMIAGLEGMLRQPAGCFEQTSSVNYPNVMILRYLKEQGIADPRLVGRASHLIDDGYKKLTAFETPQKGYEWFGSAPGHEALTAYGLVEFTDMKAVYHDVDKQMVARTADWLRGRRDGKGGFSRDAKSLDTFGSASPEVTNAYITWSLSEARQPGFEAEVDSLSRVAQHTSDSYVLALATGTMFNSGHKGAGQDAARRLVQLQESDGSWKKESHSITRSGGENLLIETTSLAVLALLKSGAYEEQTDRAVDWLVSHRRAYGAWGATQATVLGLKALTAYASARGRQRTSGTVTLLVNGVKVGTRSYEPEDREALTFSGFTEQLRSGKNSFELRHTGSGTLPFSMGVEYRASTPASSTQSVVELSTALERPQVKLGESVRLNVTVRNKTDKGQPMTLARVEIPGGLMLQTWQLKELREKGLIAFYETQPREVNLYLRQLKPGETVQLPLDLLAFAPGEFTSQASSAYLYYTDEYKTWVNPTKVSVEP